MMSMNRFYIFAILGIALILNTTYLYPWILNPSLIESMWITIGTIAAIVAYFIALKSNYAPFQTFIMRIIFWGYSIMFFLSIMRRTFEFVTGYFSPFGYGNTILYLAIVLFCTFEGHRLFYSYGVNNKNRKKAAPKTSSNKKAEDLTKIEGIGPVIQKLLIKNKISTYEDVSKTSVAELQQLLDDNKLGNHDPTTWPKQAALAFNGEWEKLQKWQDELIGGRK